MDDVEERKHHTQPEVPPLRPATVVNLIVPSDITVRLIHTTQREQGQAITAVLTIGGQLVGTSAPNAGPQINIDEQNKLAEIHWVDDHGDTDADAPSNAQIAFDSDNPSVATVDAQSGKITPVAEGSFNLSVEFTDSTTGGPLMEPDGQTPFQVTTAPVQIVAGAAVGAELEVKDAS